MPHRHIKVLLVTLFQSGYFTAPPVKVEKLQPYKINVGRAYVISWRSVFTSKTKIKMSYNENLDFEMELWFYFKPLVSKKFTSHFAKSVLMEVKEDISLIVAEIVLQRHV